MYKRNIRWLKDIDKCFDGLLTESYQIREMEMEYHINRLRFLTLSFLFVFELIIGLLNLGLNWTMVGIDLGTYFFTGLWCFAVSKWSKQNHYQPWLKYATVLMDFMIITLVLAEVEYLAGLANMLTQMRITEFELMVVSLLMLFNILSAFRQGKLIIYFSTVSCLITATLILQHSHTDRTVQIHEQFLIIFSGVLAWSLSSYMTGTYTRLRHRERLLRYLPKKLVTAVETGQVDIEPGGERQNVTVLMADIRGFTSMCENSDPEVITHLLNRYFAVMSHEIFMQGGMIDKFIGDAIMAVFGAPQDEGNCAECAIKAGQNMLARLPSLNEEFAKENLPEVHIGIGIHSGEVIAGNVGSSSRMDYTVIGDTVNVAARIESLTKELGKTLLVSATTVEQSNNSELTPLTEMNVKGRKQAVVIYSA